MGGVEDEPLVVDRHHSLIQVLAAYGCHNVIHYRNRYEYVPVFAKTLHTHLEYSNEVMKLRRLKDLFHVAALLIVLLLFLLLMLLLSCRRSVEDICETNGCQLPNI